MTVRRGQVALYLVMVLVAVTVLAMMNVGAFLAVRARNRTMNAGDAASLAAAREQGELLNRIGRLNVEHLAAVVRGGHGDLERCRLIEREQARLCFLGPLDGLVRGNEVARDNGVEKSDGMEAILRQHVIDIRTIYAMNPELYPPPWENAWEEYAAALEAAIGGGVTAGPDNVDFVDAVGGHLLLNPRFYDAIAGRCWCWFHFNARGLLDSYSSYRDWQPPSVFLEESRAARCANSEVFSLHLEPRTGSALQLFGKPLVSKLTGIPEAEMTNMTLLASQDHTWYFYGGLWRTWWEIDPEGEWQFPVTGRVKPEYDVRGCAAVCRCTCPIPDVVIGSTSRESVWSGAAKPFGTVEDENGETAPVTALGGLVTPAFTAVRLVPLDTVGGRDLSTADPDWMGHVRNHLPAYLKDGLERIPRGCFFCLQLVQWEEPAFRERGREWLKANSRNCVRGGGPGPARGGTAHGH